MNAGTISSDHLMTPLDPENPNPATADAAAALCGCGCGCYCPSGDVSSLSSFDAESTGQINNICMTMFGTCIT